MSKQVETKQPAHVLDFLLQTFAPAKEEDLYNVLQQATERQLESALNAYGDYAKRGIFKAPPRDPNHFRPYLPNDQRLPAWALGGIRLDSESLSEPDGLWKAADAIKLSLLYCDSVAIDDLLSPLLQLTAANLRLGNVDDDDARVALLNYVQFLLHMRTHLSSRTLCLLPPDFYEQGTLNNIHGSKRDRFEENLLAAVPAEELKKNLDLAVLARKAPESVRRQWEQILARGGDEEALLRKTAFDVALKRVSIAYTTAEHENGNLSPYLFRDDVKLLSSVKSQTLLGNAAKLKDPNNRFLTQFMDLKLSGIGKIDAATLAKVRSESEVFADVRETIVDVIREINALPSDLLDREKEAQKIAREKFAEAKASFDKKTDTSPVLKGLKKGVVSLTSGSASALLVFLLAPAPLKVALLAGLTQAGITASMQSILEVIENLPEASNATNAAKSLYLALSTEEDAQGI